MKTEKYSLQALLVLAIGMMVVSCGKKSYQIPANFTQTPEKANIFPNYTNITIPSNIAPLNFMVRSVGDEFVVDIKGKGQEIVEGCGEDGKIMFDSLTWRNLLQENKGESLKVALYAHRESGWVAFPEYKIDVASEPIDGYLSYRLIEPGYELYQQLGLYQRNLTTFDVKTIYENNRKFEEGHNHCVNCHNYQNYQCNNMMFHVRGSMGGTVIAKDGKIEKLNMKNDSILSSSVYPSWHPRNNWIVFSSNQTGQIFHILHKEKIEVIDYGSDLIFYNADTKQISNVLKTVTDMETFPCWSPSGDRVFYCTAHVPAFAELPDSLHVREISYNSETVHYNLMSIPFDETTQTFGEPQLEYDCVSLGKSASVPRVSPDGKYVLFTMGDYGQFHVWHKSSDLYVKNLETGEVYPMTASNSRDSDSFHSWSSNGRWFVFSSRRDDGNFTRPYIAYFDHEGHSHKAFMLPQKDPESNLMLFKSYNVPEMTQTPVPYPEKDFHDIIYNTEGSPITYKEIRKGF